MKIDRIRLLIAAGGATIAVAGIAAGAYALHDAAAPPAASQHKAAARSAAVVPAVSAAADGATTATPDPAASTPGQQTQPQPASQQQTTSTTTQAPPPADPSPTGTPAPVVLTACTALGTTATDAGGNLVQCAGNAAAPEWVCDPDYSYPSTYPPVPGQPAPPTWQTVLDTSWNAYVMDPAGTWLVTSPPC